MHNIGSAWAISQTIWRLLGSKLVQDNPRIVPIRALRITYTLSANDTWNGEVAILATLYMYNTKCVADKKDSYSDNFISSPLSIATSKAHIFKENFSSHTWLCGLYHLLLVYCCKLCRLFAAVVQITPWCSKLSQFVATHLIPGGKQAE